VRVDKNTWLPADDTCPQDYYIAFLDGTVPNSTCSHMGAGAGMLLPGLVPGGAPTPNGPAQPGQPLQPAEPAPQKKNFFQRLFGGGNKQSGPPVPPQQSPQQ